jgi:uncharacterized protein (UPF0335 family)
MTESVASEQLRKFIERIERVEEGMAEVKADRKEIYDEAKATGFDTKTIRAIVRLRRMDKDARDEAEALLETYKSALGI